MLPYLQHVIKTPNLAKEVFSKRNFPKRKIVIDFSSPNIAKTFHIGNLRGTLTGNFLQKLYRYAGHDVTAVNYLGDWGTQFSMLSVYWDIMKDRPSPDQWQEMDDRKRIEFLTKCYVDANFHVKSNPNLMERARNVFSEMETSLIKDSESSELPAIKQWREWRASSVRYLEAFYSQFGVNFDEWAYESGQVQEAQRIANKLIGEKLAVLNPIGLWVINDIQSHQTAVLRKSDDSTLYLTREIGAIYNRHRKYNADEYMYVVDTAQSNHFIQLKAVLKALKDEELAAKIQHVNYGRVMGLSTRLGKNESVDFIIDRGVVESELELKKSHTRKLSEEELPEICKQVSKSLVIFDCLRRQKAGDYSFTFKGVFTERCALSLHEKYSRLNSLELNNQDVVLAMNARIENGNFGKMMLDTTRESQTLLQLLQEFDGFIIASYESSEPCLFAAYVLKLANHVGIAMAALKVRGEQEEKAVPRMMLFCAAKKVLGEGIRMLGIEPIKRM